MKLVKPNLQFPRVDTICIHGVGITTISKIELLADDYDGKYVLGKDDGDGTVTSDSLSYCKEWGKTSDHFEFRHLEISGCDHDDVVRDSATVERVLAWAL